jgi:hypothetical protein
MAGSDNPWWKKTLWLITIWILGVTTLGFVAYGMRWLMRAAGLTAS